MKKQGLIFNTVEDSYTYKRVDLPDGSVREIRVFDNMRNITIKLDLKNAPYRCHVYADGEEIPYISPEYLNDSEMDLIIRYMGDIIDEYGNRY